jgi:hypothetical protein
MSKRIKEELSKETLTKTTSESVEHSKSTKSRSHHSSQQNQNFFSNFCQFHFILFLIWLSVSFQQILNYSFKKKMKKFNLIFRELYFYFGGEIFFHCFQQQNKKLLQVRRNLFTTLHQTQVQQNKDDIHQKNSLNMMAEILQNHFYSLLWVVSMTLQKDMTNTDLEKVIISSLEKMPLAHSSRKNYRTKSSTKSNRIDVYYIPVVVSMTSVLPNNPKDWKD